MRYYLLFTLITAAAYAIASVAAAWSAALLWPTVRRRVEALSPAARARVLAAWRLAPAAAGAGVSTILAGAFLRFEPRDTTEDPSVLLVASALCALLFAAHGGIRLVRALKSNRACARVLREHGRRIRHTDGTQIWLVDTDYPVAAVTGVFRTALVVSRRIMSECTPGELAAVLRHERAHVDRRDNLVRAAILAAPNPLSFMTAGDQMQTDWSIAAEEAADDAAGAAGAAERTALAAALVRVARMARTPAPSWIPALAFYEGSNLEHRVRRLLGANARATRLAVRSLVAMTAAAAAYAVALTDVVAREVHAWMEIVVHVVP